MKREVEEEDDEEGSETSMVDVDFDFFNFKPIDFHALNTLLKQLLGPDAIDFELGAIADVLLKSVGITVKVDGEESDPFAVLSLLDLQHEGEQVKLLKEYVYSKSKSIRKVVEATPKRVCLVVSERLINMPVDVVPHLYRMLLDEAEEYDYYLLLSKNYTEVTSQVDRKKRKSNNEVFYFHAEDEFMLQHASESANFKYTHDNPESDSRRAFHEFGINPNGSLMLFTKEGFKNAVKAVQEAIS